MKKITVITFILALVSCGTKDQKQEVISFEDLAGTTGEEIAPATPTDSDQYIATPKLKDFIKSQLSMFDTVTNTITHPLDRFGYSTAIKLDFKQKVETDKLSSVSLFYYSFADTISTKNAFYNWLDCFGNNCESVQLNKNLDKLNTDAAFALVYDTTIVAVEYKHEDDLMNRKSFQDSLVKKFGKSYHYRFEVKSNGPFVWK